jgi:hypothetical protein
VFPALQAAAKEAGTKLDVFEVDAGDSMGLTNEHEVSSQLSPEIFLNPL